jgi:G3E family GTPase
MCCTLAGPMAAGIAQLVRQAKPDRLLIEPSGLGHPASLLDVLQGEHLRTSLLVQAIICLVDPCKVCH